VTRTCKLDSGFMDRSKDLTTVSFLAHIVTVVLKSGALPPA